MLVYRASTLPPLFYRDMYSYSSILLLSNFFLPPWAAPLAAFSQPFPCILGAMPNPHLQGAHQ